MSRLWQSSAAWFTMCGGVRDAERCGSVSFRLQQLRWLSASCRDAFPHRAPLPVLHRPPPWRSSGKFIVQIKREHWAYSDVEGTGNNSRASIRSLSLLFLRDGIWDWLHLVVEAETEKGAGRGGKDSFFFIRRLFRPFLGLNPWVEQTCICWSGPVRRQRGREQNQWGKDLLQRMRKRLVKGEGLKEQSSQDDLLPDIKIVLVSVTAVQESAGIHISWHSGTLSVFPSLHLSPKQCWRLEWKR